MTKVNIDTIENRTSFEKLAAGSYFKKHDSDDLHLKPCGNGWHQDITGLAIDINDGEAVEVHSNTIVIPAREVDIKVKF